MQRLSSDKVEKVRAIFDREIARAAEDWEPSAHIEWLKRLRDEVVEVIAHPSEG